MGISYTVAAGNTIDKWQRACRFDSGSSNTFTAGRNTYFFETESATLRDYGIRGEVYLTDDKRGTSRRVARFTVDGKGFAIITVQKNAMACLSDTREFAARVGAEYNIAAR